ncbi:zeaxanthin epoxidase, chloroplastic-like [Dorcoceras hygrometricum]|uniref:Zeaxanthin epoxidase, chloroplastic-like n=1 Tax=Dorcoceras hygrometricum TaxID=472368 RepID=A0A2Z7DJL5_9LAMI|nr:zeaxanthin epoxidase, chloroplastic-like [Dorcoceras hygrometricum]
MLNKQLHLLLPTHEMWELPTPLIAANKPSREKRDTGVTRSASEKALNKLKGRIYTYPKKLGAKSDAYANRLHKGDVFAHLPLQANIRKQYPNEASQQEESNATTLTLVGAVYRRKSKKIRSVTQLTLTQLTAESSSPIQNAVVPTNPNDDVLANPNDDVLAPATKSTLSHH